MIQISHNDINSIIKLHFEACSNFVLPRLDFYIDLFNSLGNKNYLEKSISLTARYNLTSSSIVALVTPFLSSKYKKGNTKVDITQVNSLLKSRSNRIIKNSNSLNTFKTYYNFFLLVKRNIEIIISGNPLVLDQLLKSNKFNIQGQPEIKGSLEKGFSYETFTGVGFQLNNKNKWNNYSLTSRLNLSVCPYCNRNWINTVLEGKTKKKSGKITNPQLDHFLSKEKYPLFRLSFFNLIPSCETCNVRLKGSEEFNIKEYLHPYLEGFPKNVFFNTTPLSLGALQGFDNDYRVELDLDSCDLELKKKIERNLETFKIKEIYKEHGDIIADVYLKKFYYGDKYLEVLKVQFDNLPKNNAELYRLAFGNYLNEYDFKNRPFSKLTKDVARQLGLLNY